jgi:hypothetical protein
MPPWFVIFSALILSAAFIDLNSASSLYSHFLPAVFGLFVIVAVLKRKRGNRSRKRRGSGVDSGRSGSEWEGGDRSDSDNSSDGDSD